MIEIILDSAVRAGTPILFATIGAIINERAGVINLGMEGLILVGALSGFATAYFTGNIYIGVVASFIFAAFTGAIHGILTTFFRANQIVSGLAITMFGAGITALLGRKMVGVAIDGFDRIKIPLLSELPIIGKAFFNQDILIYLSFVITAVSSVIVFKSFVGLKLRTVGENPSAADTSGISVMWYRFAAVTIGSGFAGLGGAYLSLAYTPLWVENMSAGRGWIAVALVIFASWNFNRALFGAYLFGGITAVQLRLQAVGADISSHLLQMMPYIFTIAALIFSTIKLEKGSSSQPESLGLSYDREERH